MVFLLLSSQLLESPRTLLLHQLQRMRQQREREEAGSAALRSASGSEAAEGEEEGQPSGDDDDHKGLNRETVSAQPGFRKKHLLDFRDEPMVPGKIVASRSESWWCCMQAREGISGAASG